MEPSNDTASSVRGVVWKVRPATPSDKQVVEELLRSSYSQLLATDYPNDFLEKALPLICGANDRLLTCGTWYVVENHRSEATNSNEQPPIPTLVGCGGWTADAPRAPGISQASDSKIMHGTLPHLRHFATHPKYTRQGIGSALWARTWKDVCEFYHPKDAKPFSPPGMEVFSTFTARKFYESLGFEVVKKLEIPLAEDVRFPSFLMKRPEGLENK